MFRRSVVVLGVFCLAFSGVGAVSATVYTVTDLNLGGTGDSEPWGINQQGQVVGTSYNTNHEQHAFLYTGSSMIDLGPLAGGYSEGFGLNDHGQAVGMSHAGFSTSTPKRAFLFDGSASRDLNVPGYTNRAYGINNSGQVVGWSDGHGFFYSGSAMIDLNSLGVTYARDINDAGQFVGQANIRAFRYSGSQMLDLGTLGGAYSEAYGINSTGQVVGWADINSSYYHAFLYSGSTMRDLGTLGGTRSKAWGINDNGQAVGWSYLPGDVSQHAFLYDGSRMIDLNTCLDSSAGSDRLYEARSINDAGQIVCCGSVPGKIHAALLLTPISVPEPSTLVLLGVGAIGLLAYAWRRRKGRA